MYCEEFTVENLIRICKNVDNEDSYAVSPVYYLMTGRKGGMIYKNEQQSIIAIIHPNADNCVLVYPAISKFVSCADLTQEFKIAKKILVENPQKEVKIARVPVLVAEKYKYANVEEELLDWKYPVHILDVDGVVSLRGKGYQQIRQRLNNLSIEMCVVKQINVYEDTNNILDIALRWANNFPYMEYSSNDLISPTKILLKLMQKTELNILGNIIYYNGTASAYCIWEERGCIANAYAMSADRNIAGLAEYNIVSMCQQLFSHGIKKVNVGGSESEGLNQYKRKFAPIKSIILKSCVVR